MAFWNLSFPFIGTALGFVWNVYKSAAHIHCYVYPICTLIGDFS